MYKLINLISRAGCALCLCLVACGSPTVKTLKTPDFGNAWPFAVDAGIIECRNGKEIVFTSGTNTYAVNGAAKQANKYRDIEEIWKPNPQIPGAKIDISPIISQGMDLCK